MRSASVSQSYQVWICSRVKPPWLHLHLLNRADVGERRAPHVVDISEKHSQTQRPRVRSLIPDHQVHQETSTTLCQGLKPKSVCQVSQSLSVHRLLVWSWSSVRSAETQQLLSWRLQTNGFIMSSENTSETERRQETKQERQKLEHKKEETKKIWV